ncbi:MAG: hypothetical protein R2788_06995 [Saprospiraceae bacterium]
MAAVIQAILFFTSENVGDPFFPPNSQSAIVRQQILLENAVFPTCLHFGQWSCTRVGMLVSSNARFLSMKFSTAGPKCSAWGQTDGTIQLFAEGWTA